MKKIYSLLILVLIAYSCSDVDDVVSKDNPQQRKPSKVISVLDPTKLARMIFEPGTNFETRWYFYPNGLVKKIVKADGTILKDFVYDTNSDVITMHTLTGGSTLTYNFTYDSSHRITSINGEHTNYDPINNQYYGSSTIPFNDPECPECYTTSSLTISLSAEYLPTEQSSISTDFVGQNTYTYGTYGIYAGYSNNNNMIFTGNWGDPTHSTYSHDNKVNPLKAASLPVCRALAFFSSDFKQCMGYGIYNSANNVVFNNYGNDPAGQTTGYAIEYNTNDLPRKTTTNSYYFGILEDSHISALYYYQGDVIPN